MPRSSLPRPRPRTNRRAATRRCTRRRRATSGNLAKPIERALSQVRAVVEHPFHIVKNRFHHKKLRYRGLHKNTAQLYTRFALVNLVIVKQALLNRPGG
jgi:IS5 family transposase